MLIEPQIPAQLARICDVLETTALADMAAPYAQRQLKAGLHALRDLGVRMNAQPQWLGEDVDDMITVLTSLGAGTGIRESLTGVSLFEQHLQWQGRVEAFEASLDAHDVPAAQQLAARRELRALYTRMLRRESDARRQKAPDASGSD